MKAEPSETPKAKPRINIPEGAVVILPLRNAVLFPSTIMPLVVGRPASLQAIEETVRQQLRVGFVGRALVSPAAGVFSSAGMMICTLLVSMTFSLSRKAVTISGQMMINETIRTCSNTHGSAPQ